MNVYYTAKDIEELAASGIKELVLSPGAFLTDYARETAKQFEIALVRQENQGNGNAVQPPVTAATGMDRQMGNDPYNKPTGCQHASAGIPQTSNSQTARPTIQSGNGANPTTVNKLVDLMGKALKRGG